MTLVLAGPPSAVLEPWAGHIETKPPPPIVSHSGTTLPHGLLNQHSHSLQTPHADNQRPRAPPSPKVPKPQVLVIASQTAPSPSSWLRAHPSLIKPELRGGR